MAGMFAATGSMGAMAAEKITEAKAKEIALEDAGLSESDLIYDRIEMGHEQGASVYEISELLQPNMTTISRLPMVRSSMRAGS